MTDSGFQGIDPAELAELMRTVASGVNSGRALAGPYLAQFSRLGLDSGPVQKLLADYGWAASQQPMLQRRCTLAAHEPSGDWQHGFATAGAGALAYTTPAAAKQAGTAAGKQLRADLDAKDWPAVKRALAALGANQFDPAYTAALFAQLGPAGLYALSQYAPSSKPDRQPERGVIGNALATSGYGLTELLKQQEAVQDQDAAVEANAWWNLLPGAAQDTLIQSASAQVGRLDGLPAGVRDRANRIVLTLDFTQAQTQIAGLDAQVAKLKAHIVELKSHPSIDTRQFPLQIAQGKLASLQAELSPWQGKLTGMNAIKAQLGQPGQGQPPVYLLGFDTSGNGHAIVSFGNPDTAANVVTYVPGLGSKLSGAGGDMNRASRLYAQASEDDPKAATASVYWLGYNAPQLTADQSIGADLAVGFTGDALAGAPALDSFAAGLRAAHVSSSAAHTVVLGHSYGSVLVGEADRRAQGKLADDLIFVGSPGVTVNNVAGLDMKGQHVWAGHAAWDEVPDLPPWDPIGWLSLDGTHFGTDPASPPFGAEDFQTAPGSPWPLLSAHSSYWDVDSTSLRNMGYIVAGQYGSVTLARPAIPDPRPLASPTPPPVTAAPAQPPGHPVPSPAPVQQPSPAP